MDDITDRFIGVYEHCKAAKKVSGSKDFAAKINISTSMMTEITKKRSRAGINVIQNTVLYFPEIDAEWLLTGKGDMLKTTAPETTTDNATLQLQNKLIAMQEKEIARLEKVNSELRIVAAGLSQSPGDVTSGLVETKKKLINK